MAWKDIKYLLSCGHVIGAHALTHARLSAINEEDELMDEIVSSGNRLEEILGKQIDWFAYPFGDIGSINSKSLKIISSRYHYCCSGLRGINIESTHRMCILRECIDLDKPINYLKELVLGGLDFSYYLNRKKLLKMTRF
jgi:peptidoglycan/xylan/chitin deacetylase (PgdA/CDA1 family)